VEDLDVNNYLLKENLFGLFKNQLKKDFEGAGLSVDFTDDLPLGFDALKTSVMMRLEPLLKNNSTLLSSLLYRIDISEIQLQNYQRKNPSLPFDEVLAELIIKRILQKVIFKKTFSK
jgi:hypothetical protein